MKSFVLSFLAIISLSQVYSQCSGFPATVAEPNCGAGNPLASGANINSGDVYSFCGTSSSSVSFHSINLSGGTINVCGNATISSGNWNSGTVVVSCGSTLTFSSSLTLNSNVKIVNYGRVNINGNLTFQNNGNCFYNETQHSSLYVSGDIVWPQNSSDYSYLKNYGYVSVGAELNAKNGAYICTGNGSIIETVDIRYGTGCGAPSNRFTFDGSSGSSIIRYTGTANLRGTMTSSGNIFVNKGSSASTASTCGSWGSAVVATNSPAYTIPSSPGPCSTPLSACYFALPVRLTSFTAVYENALVRLNWEMESIENIDFFKVLRSSDGIEWDEMANVSLNTNENKSYLWYDNMPLSGIAYYKLIEIDLDETNTQLALQSVLNPRNSISVYPNPASSVVTICGQGDVKVTAVQLNDTFGRSVSIDTNIEENCIKMNLQGLQSGTYLLQVTESNGEVHLEKLIVQ